MAIVKNIKGKKKGFILILTIFVLSLVVAMVTYLATTLNSSQAMSSVMIDRSRARNFALNGIELVRGALAHVDGPKGDKSEFEWLVRNINRWQRYELQDGVGEIDGTLHIYVTCEEGKVNLNDMFDVKKKKFEIEQNSYFKDLWERIGTLFKQSGKTKSTTSLKEFLLKHLKDRTVELDDLSEIFAEESLARVPPIFPLVPEIDKDGKEQKAILGFTDLFTALDESHKLQPLFFAPGMCDLYGFKQLPSDLAGREKIIKDLANLKKTDISWAREWDKTLGPLFGKKYEQLEGLIRFSLAKEIAVHTISVLCYGKLGEVTVGVCAILRRHATQEKKVVYQVKKLYWI